MYYYQHYRQIDKMSNIIFFYLSLFRSLHHNASRMTINEEIIDLHVITATKINDSTPIWSATQMAQFAHWDFAFWGYDAWVLPVFKRQAKYSPAHISVSVLIRLVRRNITGCKRSPRISLRYVAKLGLCVSTEPREFILSQELPYER